MGKAIYIQRGEVIDFKNSTENNVVTGDVVVLGARVGVATVDIPVGATGAVSVQGVYEIDAETTAAFNVGQKIYFADGKLTATSGSVEAGFAVAPKLAANGKARIKIG